jgi:hypothetical protein
MAKIYGDLVCIPVHGTLEEWETENPILLEGQEGIVITDDPVYYKKIGDGVTHWVDLPWKTGPQGEQGPPGDDYVLTDADLTEIANKVLANFIDVSEVGQ